MGRERSIVLLAARFDCSSRLSLSLLCARLFHEGIQTSGELHSTVVVYDRRQTVHHVGDTSNSLLGVLFIEDSLGDLLRERKVIGWRGYRSWCTSLGACGRCRRCRVGSSFL